MSPHDPARENVLNQIRQSEDEIGRLIQAGALDPYLVLESLRHMLQGRLLDYRFQDTRTVQAWKLYCAGWGRKLGCNAFDEYLAEVPDEPEWPDKWKSRLDRSVLVDTRIPLRDMCDLLNIIFLGDDDTWVDFTPEKAKQEGVYWIFCQDGRRNRGRDVREVRRASAPFEVGLTAVEGIALYVQDPTVLDKHFMELPGSVLRRRGYVAFLRHGEDGLSLDWIPSGHNGPQFGAASRGE